MAGKVLVAVALLVAVMAARPASATPLTTPVKTVPDLASFFISVNYSADTRFLQAFGFVSTYQPDTSTLQVIDGYTFNLGALMNSNGTFSSGDLDIFNPDTQDRLLTGQLAALGFAGGDPAMQFLFNVTGGSLAPDFGPQAFVNLNYSGFETAQDGFNSDWNNMGTAFYGDGTADTFATAVPEPSTVSLLLLGAGGLILHRRRKAAGNA